MKINSRMINPAILIALSMTACTLGRVRPPAPATDTEAPRRMISTSAQYDPSNQIKMPFDLPQKLWLQTVQRQSRFQPQAG